MKAFVGLGLALVVVGCSVGPAVSREAADRTHGGAKADEGEAGEPASLACDDLSETMWQCLAEHAEGCFDIYAAEVAACCAAESGIYWYCDRLAAHEDCAAADGALRGCVAYGLEEGEEISECLDEMDAFDEELLAACCDTGRYYASCHFADTPYSWLGATPSASQPGVDVGGGEGGRVGALELDVLGVDPAELFANVDGANLSLSHVARAAQEAFGNEFCDFRFVYPEWSTQSPYAFVNWLRATAEKSADEAEEDGDFEGYMLPQEIDALVAYLDAHGGVGAYQAFYSRAAYASSIGCDIVAEVSANLLWNAATNHVVFVEMFATFQH